MNDYALSRKENRWFWLMPALAVMLLFSRTDGPAQGTIVYQHLSNPDLVPHLFEPYDSQGMRLNSFEIDQPVFYQLALNEQGIPTYAIASGQGFTIEGSSGAAVLSGRLGPAPFFSALAIPLAAGSLIGTDSGGYEWAQDRAVFTASRARGIEGNPQLNIGFFTGLDSAYAGLKFTIDGQTHYGWLRVGAPAVGLNGGWIYDYAYETRPDMPILAGAVPEPSVWVLGGVGLLALFIQRRTRSSCRRIRGTAQPSVGLIHVRAMNDHALKRNGNRWCWLLPALAVVLLDSQKDVSAQGTIVYQHLWNADDVPHFFEPYDSLGMRLLSFDHNFPVYYNLILNQQGTANYTLSSGTAFSIYGNGTAAVLSGRLGSFLPSALAIPLPAGYLIGDDPGSYEWAQDSAVFNAARASGIIGDPVLTIGFFTGLDSGYAGLKFLIDGQTHYGWIRVGAPGINLNGGWIYDYAYETRPDMPILAGAVPEPSVWVLGGVGLLALFIQRRTRSSCRRIRGTAQPSVGLIHVRAMNDHALKRNGNRWCWLLPALAVMLLFSKVDAFGQGTIVYGRFPITSPLDPNTPFYPYDSQGYRLLSWEPFPGVSYGLALNPQGDTTYTFVSGQAFAIEGSSTAGILAVRTGSIFNDFWVTPLPAGYLIGADPREYEWAQEHTVLTAARASGIEGDPLLTIGFFTGLDSAYAGLKFEIDGQTHYGWVRVGAPGTGLNGGWLYDYAYETRPDTPILAGAVPEPSVWTLFALAVIIGCFVRSQAARRVAPVAVGVSASLLVGSGPSESDRLDPTPDD